MRRGGDTIVKAYTLVAALAVISAAPPGWAGDADIGRRLAQSRCAPCHVVGRPSDGELSAAPPFAVIARKFPAGSGSLIVALRGPHPKMNFSPTQREAEDIAEYIRTLAH